MEENTAVQPQDASLDVAADLSPRLRRVPHLLKGDRVTLRAYSQGDINAFWQAIDEARPHLTPWQDWIRRMTSKEEAEIALRTAQSDWILKKRLAWGIDVKGEYVGHIQLEHIEWETPSFGIGYWLRASAQGNGYITEAAKLISHLCFETLGAQRLHIECDEKNVRCAAVAKRLGFTREAVLRHERRDPDGTLQNTLVFAMIPEDYKSTLHDETAASV